MSEAWITPEAQALMESVGRSHPNPDALRDEVAGAAIVGTPVDQSLVLRVIETMRLRGAVGRFDG